MSTAGGDPVPRPPLRRPLADAVAARRRAGLVSGLRGMARADDRQRAPISGAPIGEAGNGQARPSPAADAELCDLCGLGIPDDHRHLLELVERRIVCACEACWAMRSGEGDYRPTGNRTVWLAGPGRSRRPLGVASRSRSGWRSSWSRQSPLRRGAVSEPGGRDRERAALRLVEPDARAQPGP